MNMCHRNNVKKGLVVLSVLLMALFNQPMKAHAFANLHKDKGHDVDKSHDQGDDHGHDGDKQDEHQDEHQDDHHGQ
jgi:hypothetical protein